jgi:hypothetical protein
MVSPLHNREGFFKYYSADAAKLTLRRATRKWSSPLEFNDPFDNQFDLCLEEPSDDSASRGLDRLQEILNSPNPIEPNRFGALTPKLEYLRRIFAVAPDPLNDEESVRYLREGILEGMQRASKSIQTSNVEIRRILADTSIFCVSETHDNLLMWSHYAQNHTGAVVKFLSLAQVDSPLMMAQPVRYASQLPHLTFSDLLEEDTVVKVYEAITLSKSDVWSYEKEWRVVTSLRDKEKTFEILPFAPEEVGAVYLGCRMTDNDRREIVAISRQRYRGAKIYQAIKHTRDFALVFEELA